ncbi:MAG: sugar transferase [Tissierellia bacterium]|nr:sugar transferase [Tissierellia bacterium]
MRKKGLYERFFKRFLDILLSLIALVLFWWLILIIAILVRVKLGSPILFKQSRPGKDGEVFNLYKFRTMTDENDSEGKLLPDDIRLTKFGRFLRSTSMDELPELFNIMIGDMSIVGPRPLFVSYLPYYTKEESIRHDVRPGLTGWAQVNGRNATNWDERLEQDIYYVDNISFLLDIKIVFMTAFKVLKRSDILVGKQIKAGRLDVVRKDRMLDDGSKD